MEDEIRIRKTENGGTVMVNVSAINRLIDELSCESAIERLKRSSEICREQPKKISEHPKRKEHGIAV